MGSFEEISLGKATVKLVGHREHVVGCDRIEIGFGFLQVRCIRKKLVLAYKLSSELLRVFKYEARIKLAEYKSFHKQHHSNIEDILIHGDLRYFSPRRHTYGFWFIKEQSLLKAANTKNGI